MKFSFWEQQEIFDNIDYCIVGGGIVGSCTAILLREKFPNAKIVILERGILPKGASTKNAGFACFGSVTEILDDLQKMSEQEVIDLIKLRIEGLQLLRELTDESKIDFNAWGGYEVFDPKDLDNYQTEIPRLNGIVESASGLQNTFSIVQDTFNLSFDDQIVFNQYEAQLHPMKMMRVLHRKVQSSGTIILHGVDVESQEGKEVKLNLPNEQSITISSDCLLLCTNAFSKKFLPDENLQPARNQVLLTEPIDGLKLKGTFHYDRGYVYFRNVANRILIGGARNLYAEEETTEEFGGHRQIIDHLKELVRNKIVQNQSIKFEHQWSGIIAVGPTKKPIIKQIEPGLYAACRLGGMGVAIGSKVAESLVELVVHNS